MVLYNTWALLFQKKINEEKYQIIIVKASFNIRKYLRVFHSFNIRNMRILHLWGWVDRDVGRLYVSSTPSAARGTTAPTKSSPVK